MGTATVEPDWSEVARRVRDEATDDWDDTVAVKRLEDSGARFDRGRGVLDGPGRVRVDGTTYVARKGVVLNTGTRPAAPPIDGLEGTPYWTNRDAVTVTELPASLVVLGGGPIGCEFAQVFARYGVDVTVVEVGRPPGRGRGARGLRGAHAGVHRRGHHRARRRRRSTR